MAICATCKGDMTERISCIFAPIAIGDSLFDPVRWGDESGRRRSGRGWKIDGPCPDCGTPPGGVHHPGCCLESCPNCFGQALGCPCFGDPDADLDLYDQLAQLDRTIGRRRPRRRIRRFCHSHVVPRRRR